MCAGDILRGGRTRRQNSLTDLELFPALSSRYLRFPDRIRITTSATARGILLWIKDLDCWSRTTEMQNVRSSSDNRDHTFEARRDAWKKGIAVELRWGRGPRPQIFCMRLKRMRSMRLGVPSFSQSLPGPITAEHASRAIAFRHVISMCLPFLQVLRSH